MLSVDRSGILGVNIFHIYGGSFKKIGIPGDFCKVSVRVTRPDSWALKKSKHKAIIIRTQKQNFKKDGSWVKFFNNEGVILKKRTTPIGSEIYGPTPFSLKRKRLQNSFPGII